MTVEVTKHATSRMVKRCGVSKKSIDRLAEKALAQGLTRKDVSGSLARYLDKLYLSRRVANNIRIYAQKVFLFKGTMLITVLDLPTRYYKTVEKLKTRQNHPDQV